MHQGRIKEDNIEETFKHEYSEEVLDLDYVSGNDFSSSRRMVEVAHMDYHIHENDLFWLFGTKETKTQSFISKLIEFFTG